MQPGGNPFEGPRSDEYPLPPLQSTNGALLFEKATRELGYHPFPQAAANASRAYTNPHGAQLSPCNFCGFCERYGCYMYANASLQTTPEACRHCHPGRACRARRIRVEIGDRPVVCRRLSLGDAVVRRIGTAQCLAADRQPGSRTHLRVPLPRHWRSGAGGATQLQAVDRLRRYVGYRTDAGKWRLYLTHQLLSRCQAPGDTGRITP